MNNNNQLYTFFKYGVIGFILALFVTKWEGKTALQVVKGTTITYMNAVIFGIFTGLVNLFLYILFEILNKKK